MPNETLVTTIVLNHSYSTRNIRTAVQVQIATDSDVDKALALMEDVARRTPRVLDAPNAPAAFLASIGDNGLNLELGMWIADPENGQLSIKSAINRAILKAFAENGIRLSTPQRDIRLVNVPSPATASPFRPSS